MDGERTRFLFVNEDDTFLPSRVPRWHRNAVNSHVQHTTHHQRRVAALLRLKQTVKFPRPGLHSELHTEVHTNRFYLESSIVASSSLWMRDPPDHFLCPKEDHAATERNDENQQSIQRYEDPSWLKLQLCKDGMNRDCPPSLICQIGGLRIDPFKMYPIERKGCVSSAIDYFVQVYAPLAIRAPEDTATAREETIFPAYFRTLLHDAMLFEQIVVFSEVLQLVHKGFEVQLSEELLYRLHNVHMELGKRLQTAGDSTSDGVILTIMALVALNSMMKNFQALVIHAEGLKRIVALRGGLDNLGWDGYLRSRMLQIEAAVSAREKNLKPQQRLSYPKHPFWPDLCEKISKLPAGFRKLALTGMLSLSLIDFLGDLGSQLRDDTRKKAVSGVLTHSVTLFDIPELTVIEHWIVGILLSFCIAIDGTVRGPGFVNPIHKVRVHAQVMRLVKNSDIASCDPDFLAWAAFVLRATTEPGSEPWQWADRFIGSVPMKAGREEELEEAFWPIPKGYLTVGNRTRAEPSNHEPR